MEGLDHQKESKSKFIPWLKRLGWVGFFFFLIKGLIWIAVFFGLGKLIGL